VGLGERCKLPQSNFFWCILALKSDVSLQQRCGEPPGTQAATQTYRRGVESAAADGTAGESGGEDGDERLDAGCDHQQNVDRRPARLHTHTAHHRCKQTFFYVFLFWSRFYVSNVFYIPNVFFILKKNVGTVHSDKQINRKHFQNNSNEIDL